MLRWFLGIFPFLSVKFQVYWFHGKPIFWGGRAWRKTSLLSCHFLTWSECMRIMCNSIGFVCIYTWPTWLPASFSQRMEDVKWCDSPASSSSVSARSRFSVQKERYSNIFACFLWSWEEHTCNMCLWCSRTLGARKCECTNLNSLSTWASSEH